MFNLFADFTYVGTFILISLIMFDITSHIPISFPLF